tara:strand:+ start:356 stop:565 length:210 start_codon:yes stop_codon:yes gene_type:complete
MSKATEMLAAMEVSKSEAREWRNSELTSTDYIVGVTDHPQHSEYLAYRANLRDWPLIDTFPISSSKPTL